MKAIVFDSSTIISLVTSCLAWILRELKKATEIEFLIPRKVYEEVVVAALRNWNYKLEGVRVLNLIGQNILKVEDLKETNREASRFLNLANNLFYTKRRNLRLIHYGEAEAVGLCKVLGVKNLAVDTNLNGTKILVDLCKKYRKKIIFASTCSVYGASNKILKENSKVLPLSIYALSKLAAENYIEKRKVNYIIFRMGTIFGYSSRMRFDLVINRFIADALKKGEIKIFGGEQWRPFLYIRDALRFYEKALEMENFLNEIFNLSSFNMKILRLAKEIKKMTKCQIDIIKEIRDPRNYRVDTKKAEKTFRIKGEYNSLKRGIKEIKDNIENGSIRDPDDYIYSNVECIRKVIVHKN